MNYMLIKTHSVEEMQRRVQEALNDGWKLYGNLVVIREPDTVGNTLTYYREMVKDKEPYRRGMF